MKKYTIQYTKGNTTSMLFAIVIADSKMQAKTVFSVKYPGCIIRYMIEGEEESTDETEKIKSEE